MNTGKKRQKKTTCTNNSEKRRYMLENPMYPLRRKVRGGDNQQEIRLRLTTTTRAPQRLHATGHEVRITKCEVREIVIRNSKFAIRFGCALKVSLSTRLTIWWNQHSKFRPARMVPRSGHCLNARPGEIANPVKMPG